MSSTVGVTLRPSHPYALLARLLLLCVESVRTWGAWVFGGDAPGLSLKGGETSRGWEAGPRLPRPGALGRLKVRALVSG
jgi:hypothetical protein